MKDTHSLKDLSSDKNIKKKKTRRFLKAPAVFCIY